MNEFIRISYGEDGAQSLVKLSKDNLVFMYTVPSEEDDTLMVYAGVSVNHVVVEVLVFEGTAAECAHITKSILSHIDASAKTIKLPSVVSQNTVVPIK